jgi:hypothetical protein
LRASANASPHACYNEFGDPIAGASDRGCLVLDRFVPFEDFQGTDGLFTPNSTDRRRFPGIPMALNVINTFRATDAHFGSLTKPTNGLVNVNTAPVAVLRTVPMLSPSTIPGIQGNPDDWWWPAPSGVQPTSDIASTLAAYRDKIAYAFRPDSQGNGLEVDFRNDQVGPDAPRLVAPLGAANRDGDGRDLRTRDSAAPPTGIREQVGFGSLGELAMARKLSDPSGSVPNGNENPNNIDFLGFDGVAAGGGPTVSTRRGVSSTLYKDTSGAIDAADIPNGYAEKLEILSAALGTLSVRSDMFAVWFLVHGYQKSDCEGPNGGPMEPNQPLIPSVQRRFLMVLDRSNVVKKGDKPRIVLFQELPIPEAVR